MPAVPMNVVLDSELVEELVKLCDWMGDHGGGEREHTADARPDNCPSCQANRLAARLRGALKVTGARHKGWALDVTPVIAHADVSATVSDADEPLAVLTLTDVANDSRRVNVTHDAGWEIAWGLMAFLRMMDRS